MTARCSHLNLCVCVCCRRWCVGWACVSGTCRVLYQTAPAMGRLVLQRKSSVLDWSRPSMEIPILFWRRPAPYPALVTHCYWDKQQNILIKIKQQAKKDNTIDFLFYFEYKIYIKFNKYTTRQRFLKSKICFYCFINKSLLLTKFVFI